MDLVWQERLRELAEPEFAAYQRKIVSDSRYPMLYIRVPKLRKLARELAKSDWRSVMAHAQFETYEETLTLGLMLAYARAPFAEKQAYLWDLLPKLDSWAMTDTIAPTLKPAQRELPLVWAFAVACTHHEAEYTRRFGLILMLDYFLTPQWIPAVEQVVLELQDERYYVGMALSWLLAEMAVHDYSRVVALLRARRLEPFVHNMTIRKIRESYRFSQEQKAEVMLLKRKGENA